MTLTIYEPQVCQFWMLATISTAAKLCISTLTTHAGVPHGSASHLSLQSKTHFQVALSYPNCSNSQGPSPGPLSNALLAGTLRSLVRASGDRPGHVRGLAGGGAWVLEGSGARPGCKTEGKYIS